MVKEVVTSNDTRPLSLLQNDSFTLLRAELRDKLKLKTKKLNSVALVRKQTIPTKRPPLAGDISAKLCG
jgi:hypothetical protein